MTMEQFITIELETQKDIDNWLRIYRKWNKTQSRKVRYFN